MDRKIEKKRFTWQRILLAAAFLGALALLVASVWRNAGTSRLNVQRERLLVDTVGRGNFQEFIPVTGVVEPLRTVFIDAVEGGKVEEKFVEDGALLQTNQPILRLSNPDLMVNYLNQEATIISQINQIRNTSLLMEQQSLNLREQALDVDYQLDITGKRLERNRELHKDKVIARVEFEETEALHTNLNRRKDLLRLTLRKDSAYQALQQHQMESSLDLMQRNLAITRQSLEQLTVRAPIAGQLSGLTKELGESVARSENIGQIDDLSTFKVRVRIDEFYISRVFNEQAGSFQFAGKSYGLKIKKIYPQVSNGAFEADMVFVDKAPEGIKRGQSVSVKLELSAEEQATLLQRGGFYQSTGGHWAYVIDPATGNARKRKIRLGRQNPNFYEVLEGLQVGEAVIVSGYDNFGEKDELVIK
ncbi:MAG: HlyD family efflux transporter periplasmic adaptor subunit [Saprospirales bacterium]|nr:HlyD family efflux transporter periplasmic adaptor subunit [Saprospirales bacterium]MBK8920842.1 HlyD family efflux transporter periplasmic adaptor subunit [Saprospirales bacterium]